MELTELRAKVLEAGTSGWHLVEDGPHYRDRFVDLSTTREDGSPRYAVGADAHRSLVVLRGDVDISMTWGMPFKWDNQSRDLSADGWAQRLDLASSPEAMYADVFFRGALVDRAVLCAVHSHKFGRVCLPYPTSTRIADELLSIDEGLRYGYTASDWELNMARLIHGLDFSGDFDICLRASAIENADQPEAIL